METLRKYDKTEHMFLRELSCANFRYSVYAPEGSREGVVREQHREAQQTY